MIHTTTSHCASWGRFMSSIGGHHCDQAPCSSKLLLISAMS